MLRCNYNGNTAGVAAFPVSTKKIPFLRIASLLLTVTALFIMTSAAPFMLMLQYFQEQPWA